MFIELNGKFKACCLATESKDYNINNTSIKSWMEDSKYLNDLRKEMLDLNMDKDINEHCKRCVADEDVMVSPENTYMWKSQVLNHVGIESKETLECMSSQVNGHLTKE